MKNRKEVEISAYVTSNEKKITEFTFPKKNNILTFYYFLIMEILSGSLACCEVLVNCFCYFAHTFRSGLNSVDIYADIVVYAENCFNNN